MEVPRVKLTGWRDGAPQLTACALCGECVGTPISQHHVFICACCCESLGVAQVTHVGNA